MNVDAVIETTGLTKYYGKQPGIIDLDLEVLEGEVFGAGLRGLLATRCRCLMPVFGRLVSRWLR